MQTGSFQLQVLVTSTRQPTQEFLVQCFATRWDANLFAAWGAVPYLDEDTPRPEYVNGTYIVGPPANDTQIVVTNLESESVTLYLRLFNDYGNEILPAPPNRTLQGYRQSTTISVNQYLPKS